MDSDFQLLEKDPTMSHAEVIFNELNGLLREVQKRVSQVPTIGISLRLDEDNRVFSPDPSGVGFTAATRADVEAMEWWFEFEDEADLISKYTEAEKHLDSGSRFMAVITALRSNVRKGNVWDFAWSTVTNRGSRVARPAKPKTANQPCPRSPVRRQGSVTLESPPRSDAGQCRTGSPAKSDAAPPPSRSTPVPIPLASGAPPAKACVNADLHGSITLDSSPGNDANQCQIGNPTRIGLVPSPPLIRQASVPLASGASPANAFVEPIVRARSRGADASNVKASSEHFTAIPPKATTEPIMAISAEPNPVASELSEAEPASSITDWLIADKRGVATYMGLGIVGIVMASCCMYGLAAAGTAKLAIAFIPFAPDWSLPEADCRTPVRDSDDALLEESPVRQSGNIL